LYVIILNNECIEYESILCLYIGLLLSEDVCDPV
jgi:hypothetical protein